MLRSRIIGTGHFLPERILTNTELETMMDTTDEWIRQRTGIHQRHSAKDGEGSADLAYPAAVQALEAANVDPNDVDLVLMATTTPDYIFPASACVLQEKLGIERAAAFDMNAACSGFVYALATANSMIQTGMFKTILLAGAERVTNRLNWEMRDTAVLFGDGAGAVVLRAENGDHGVLTSYLDASGGENDLLIWPAGGSKQPIGSHNHDSSDCDIRMRGQDLFKRAVIEFSNAMKQALNGTDVSLDEIALVIPHQANIRIIQKSAERIGMSMDRVFVNVDQVGNTMAASIPIALDQAVRAGRIKDGDLILFAAFGAGLTWGSCLVRW